MEKAWLSWAHHEHLLLTLLAHGDAPHVVQVAGLQVQANRVEVVTVDAGLDFQRDWLDSIVAPQQCLFESQEEALKLAHTCLTALQSIHAMGVVHGDLKSDNLCIPMASDTAGENLCMALDQLRLIDFAYAVYKEQPLKFVLPTDPDRLTYLPEFFRQAIRNAQVNDDPAAIQQAACAQVDLFSLWQMMRSVVPATSHTSGWAQWQNWMDACERAGCETSRGEDTLDAPTKRLLTMTKSVLHQLGVTQSQWGRAETTIKCLGKQAKATPLLHVTPTPLLTPLIGLPPIALPVNLPSSEVDAQDKSTSSDLFSIDSHAPISYGSWRHHQWWLMVATLCAIFARVDEHFVQTGLKLNDTGFGLGLMAVILAVPLLTATLWQVITRSATALAWVRMSGILLCGIAVYYLMALWNAGVPAIQLGPLLLLIALLSVAFWNGLIISKI